MESGWRENYVFPLCGQESTHWVPGLELQSPPQISPWQWDNILHAVISMPKLDCYHQHLQIRLPDDGMRDVAWPTSGGLADGTNRVGRWYLVPDICYRCSFAFTVFVFCFFFPPVWLSLGIWSRVLCIPMFCGDALTAKWLNSWICSSFSLIYSINPLLSGCLRIFD